MLRYGLNFSTHCEYVEIYESLEPALSFEVYIVGTL